MSRYIRPNLLTAPLLLLASLCFANPAGAATPATSADAVAVLETKMALRDLWVEHVFWIRGYALARQFPDRFHRSTTEAHATVHQDTALAFGSANWSQRK